MISYPEATTATPPPAASLPPAAAPPPAADKQKQNSKQKRANDGVKGAEGGQKEHLMLKNHDDISIDFDQE